MTRELHELLAREIDTPAVDRSEELLRLPVLALNVGTDGAAALPGGALNDDVEDRGRAGLSLRDEVCRHVRATAVLRDDAPRATGRPHPCRHGASRHDREEGTTPPHR